MQAGSGVVLARVASAYVFIRSRIGGHVAPANLQLARDDKRSPKTCGASGVRAVKHVCSECDAYHQVLRVSYPHCNTAAFPEAEDPYTGPQLSRIGSSPSRRTVRQSRSPPDCASPAPCNTACGGAHLGRPELCRKGSAAEASNAQKCSCRASVTSCDKLSQHVDRWLLTRQHRQAA
jgi:hypothetical protein